jgi:diguanylate cyclase (GGDEF)-like protein
MSEIDVSDMASSGEALSRSPATPGGDLRARRFVVLIVALFLVVLWSFVAYWAVSSRQDAIDATEQVLRRMDHAVEEQTRRLFKLVEVALGVSDQWVLDHPGTDLRTDRRFAHLAASFGTRLGGAVVLQVADSRGNTYALDASSSVPKPFGDAEFFRSALAGDPGRMHIGAPVSVGSPGVWKIPVAKRLTLPAASVTVLVALIDLPSLMALYEDERMRPNGAIVLLQRDGTLLARAPHDDRLIGKSLVGGQLFREFLPRRETGFAKLDKTATDAMEKYISYSVMSDYPLLTVVSAARDDVLEAWRRHVSIIVFLAIVVSIVALVVARRLACMLDALSVRTAELQHLATTDIMTGVNNRNHFLQLLYHEFARARRYRTPLSLLVFDLDFFKQINDGYGHAAGDEALRAFARAAGECLRDMDVLGRLGGEEFGILLPSTLIDQAEVVAERIRSAVAGIAIRTEYGTVRFTTSVGVAQSEEGDDEGSVDVLLARADAALYAAKAAGRNRVVARSG